MVPRVRLFVGQKYNALSLTIFNKGSYMKITRINPDITIPKRGTEHAAGYDIFMPHLELIYPGETKKIKLGFATAIPVGYAALMMPRSSFGSKGIQLVNTIGLIDSDYRGEWMAVIKNTGNDPITWEPEDRVLQFTLVQVLTSDLEVVGDLDETERGEGGFGSTGK